MSDEIQWVYRNGKPWFVCCKPLGDPLQTYHWARAFTATEELLAATFGKECPY